MISKTELSKTRPMLGNTGLRKGAGKAPMAMTQGVTAMSIAKEAVDCAMANQHAEQLVEEEAAIEEDDR